MKFVFNGLSTFVGRPFLLGANRYSIYHITKFHQESKRRYLTMIETKIYDVIRRMTPHLNTTQLNELKQVLFITFESCDIIDKSENTDVMVLEDSWKYDLQDFLTSKTLEGKTEQTLERYRYELVRLLQYLNKPTNGILPSDISKYMQCYKRIRNVSNSTLSGMRSCYSAFFGWCHDNDRIDKNPMVQVEKIKVPKTIREPYTDEEREKLFRAAKNIRDKAIIEFLYSTAVRVSELVNLDIKDINWSSKDLIVYGKGDKERTVYLNDKANMYLKEYLASRTDDNPALFVSLRAPHNRITKCGVEDMMNVTGKLAGIKKSHPHKMRRTSITNAVNRGMPIQEAALFAGHASTETTLLYWTADVESVRFHHKKYLSA